MCRRKGFTLCEIPIFIVVSDLPDDGPEIRGGQPRYNIGDSVNVTCISRNSLPAAKLSWYINGEKADPIYLRTYPEETNIRTQLQTSTLGLTFKVNTKDKKGPNIDFWTSFPKLPKPLDYFKGAQRMYEMVILTTVFGEFEFSRTFSPLALQKVRENSNWNSPNVKKWGILKFPKCQKVRENSNSPNPW